MGCLLHHWKNMSSMRSLAIELKVFEIRTEGCEVLITERGWKGLQTLRLGWDTARWVLRALEECFKHGRKVCYSAYRDGNRGYIAQKGSNSRGSFLALVEYSGGGRWSFIFISGERDGMGWRKLAVVVREVGNECAQGRSLPSSSTVALPLARSYMEVVQTPRDGRNFALVDLNRVGEVPVLVGAQRREGDGRGVSGQNDVSILKDLRGMQAALEEMAVKVKGMIRCVLGKEVMGLWVWARKGDLKVRPSPNRISEPSPTS
ncbi:hypothetical protein F2P56_030421 [Juglans regia]|uniref:Uncharacterized protein n=1 Tax=Juglans regia TaxID=51240 RepID=A0A833X8G9_JUGRE|nr:hypothetical protein F2P56_030421 [Juglans regia]